MKRSKVSKPITADYIKYASAGRGVSDEVVNMISNVLTEYESSGEARFSDILFMSLDDDPVTKERTLMRVLPHWDGGVRLEVNTDVVGGKSLNELDDIISNTESNVSESF